METLNFALFLFNFFIIKRIKSLDFKIIFTFLLKI